MTSTINEANASTAAPRPRGVRHAYRLGLVVAAGSVVISLILMPFAFMSLYSAFEHPAGDHGFDVMRPALLHGEWTKLNISATSIDEVAGDVVLRVSGFHNCATACVGEQRVQLFSVHSDPSGALGPPPSATINIPADSSEIEQQVTLPIAGNLSRYPFDNYRLLLGATFSNVSASGVPTPITPASARDQLAFSVSNTIPRVSLAAPRILSPHEYDSTGALYDAVVALNFSRPLYLRILTVLLTLLIVLAAAYGVLFRPFTQIVPTVGALVLGVWGVRSLLVGSYPPDSTGVDLVLEGAILLLLLTVAVRAVVFMLPRAHLGRMRPSPYDEADESDDDELEFELPEAASEQ
ncbi:MAG: hypothetical protein ACYC0I_04850 [Acidimicrobiales bacterium]